MNFPTHDLSTFSLAAQWSRHRSPDLLQVRKLTLSQASRIILQGGTGWAGQWGPKNSGSGASSYLSDLFSAFLILQGSLLTIVHPFAGPSFFWYLFNPPVCFVRISGSYPVSLTWRVFCLNQDEWKEMSPWWLEKSTGLGVRRADFYMNLMGRCGPTIQPN